MNHSKLIQNHFGDVPVPPGHQKTCQNIILSDLGASGKFSKFRRKPIILITFWMYFLNFLHADACVAQRRASRQSLNDSQSIFLCSKRVIRRQPGASLRFCPHAPRLIFRIFLMTFFACLLKFCGAIHLKNRPSLVMASLSFEQ